MAVDIELGPADWRRMARKVVRRDILGKEDGTSKEGGLVGLLQDMERRQHEWHEKRRESIDQGSPCSEGDVGQAGGKHLCLKVIGLARAGIAGLDLDPSTPAGAAKVAEASTDIFVDDVAAVPQKSRFKFSDNMNRWPYTSIDFEGLG